MFPEILQLGPFTLRSFGLMAALGFLAAYLVLRCHSERVADMLPDDSSRLLVVAMVGGALGARAAYVAEHWSAEFASGPLVEILRFDRGGLMFYGGLGGAIVAIAAFSLVERRPFGSLLDLSAIALSLGHAFGRVGCFLNGCCYGRISECAISVRYPAGSEPWLSQVREGLIARSADRSLPLLPAQLIEALLNIALFVALSRLSRRNPPRWTIAGAYLVAYSAIRFFTETLRSDPRMAVGPFSIAQFICVFAFAAGCAALLWARLHGRTAANG